ncbi:hypothetical protein ACLBX9_26725 [Methylobacterium sp. A49B]
MSSHAARLRTADRATLMVLCLLLLASVSARIVAYRSAASDSDANTVTIAPGERLALPLHHAGRRLLRIAACPTPVLVDFVEPSPHGRDTSLMASPDPSDRTTFVYRGWTLAGPRAVMKLSMLYFMYRAGAVLGVSGPFAGDERAVKLVVPGTCDAAPGAILSALYDDLQPLLQGRGTGAP